MNQYRCETCEHHEDITDAFYNTIWCKKHDATINPSTINLVGCASHSNFQSERYIQCTVCGSEATHPHCDICFGLAMENHRQEERDKVLDEGIAQIQKRIDGIFEVYRGEKNELITERPFTMADGMGEAILILKELRQAGEP